MYFSISAISLAVKTWSNRCFSFRTNARHGVKFLAGFWSSCNLVERSYHQPLVTKKIFLLIGKTFASDRSFTGCAILISRGCRPGGRCVRGWWERHRFATLLLDSSCALFVCGDKILVNIVAKLLTCYFVTADRICVMICFDSVCDVNQHFHLNMHLTKSHIHSWIISKSFCYILSL